MTERREIESSRDQECVILNVSCIEFIGLGICLYVIQLLTKICTLIKWYTSRVIYL